MTPLAQRIVKELMLPAAKRDFEGPADFLEEMSGVHCFDVTEVVPIIEAATDADTPLDRWVELAELEKSGFLPAPKTWIEHSAYGERRGWLLQQMPDGGGTQFTVALGKKGFLGVFPERFVLPIGDCAAAKCGIFKHPGAQGETSSDLAGWLRDQLLQVPVALALINEPRMVGREQHAPHRGIERAIERRGLLGAFPLHAWTEIKLEISVPASGMGATSDGHILTGSKALHFCRSHLRVQNGRLVIVRAHWRGDPALGIKQSRYKLVNPKKPAGDQ
jgi:hypothetical protein